MIYVSFIIPCYNSEQYLAECLQSVCQQRLQDIEIICINDGSTDTTSEILNEWQQKDARIRVISQENQGVSAARNHGIEAASGNYIYCLDSDDMLFDADIFNNLLSILQENETDIIVGAAQTIYESEDLKVHFPEFENRYQIHGTYDPIMTGQEAICKLRKNKDWAVTPGTRIFRRVFLKEHHLHFLEGCMHEDSLYTLQTMVLARRVQVISDHLYFRRIHEGSIMTKSPTHKNVLSYLTIYRKEKDFLDTYTQMDAAVWESAEMAKKMIKRTYASLSSEEKIQLKNHMGDEQRADFYEIVRELPICFITDNQYVLSTLTAIESLFESKAPDSCYQVYVIVSSDISLENRQALETLNGNIHVIPVDGKELYNQFSTGSRHVSPMACYKFDLARLLPHEEILLYLDTDIIVQKDLSELLQTKLQDSYAAAVETFSAPLLVQGPLSYLPVNRIFNSGVMLLNLKKMREDHIREKLMEYRTHGTNRMMDQDAFNAVFHDQVIFLPPFYNLQYTSTYRFTAAKICELYKIPRVESWDELSKKASILHYNSDKKPWLYQNVWKAELWYEFYSHLPQQLQDKYVPEQNTHPTPLFPQQKDPLVSIIVPSYNIESFIDQCLSSISGQTFQDYEVLCIDGGSTDGTISHIKEFCEKDSRINLVQMNCASSATARNKGLLLASGKYVTFIDGDDYVKPDMLQMLVGKAEKEGSQIVCFPCRRYDGRADKEFPGNHYLTKSKFPDNLFQLTPSYVINKFYNRSFLEEQQLHFQELACFDDTFFTYASLAAADKIHFLTKPLYYHRARNGSKNDYQWQQFPLFMEAVNLLYAYLQEHGKWQKLCGTFYALVLENMVTSLRLCSKDTIRSYTLDLLDRELFPGFRKWIEQKRADLPEHPYKNIELITGTLEYRKELLAAVAEPYQFRELTGHTPGYVPTVSVILPVYNSALYLEESLASVLSQTLKDVEVICIDDGSQDDSLRILNEYSKRDSRIRVFSQTHAGVSIARNVGIEHATGEFLYFMDSDDILRQDALDTMVRTASMYRLDILYFNAQVFYDESCSEAERKFQPNYQRKHSYPQEASGKEFFVQFTNNHEMVVTIWMCLYRRSLIRDHEILFYPGIVHSDNLFTFHTMLNADRAGYLDQQLYCRRIRPGSLMTATPYFLSSYSYYILDQEIIAYLCRHRAALSDTPELIGAVSEFAARIYRCAKRDYKKLSNYEKGKAFALTDAYGHFREIVMIPSELDITIKQKEEKLDNLNQALTEASKKNDQLQTEFQQVSKKNDELSEQWQIALKSFDEATEILQKKIDEEENSTQELHKQNEQIAKSLRDSQHENKTLRFKIDQIQHSKSFRIGRAVTWLPRKIRDLSK